MKEFLMSGGNDRFKVEEHIFNLVLTADIYSRRTVRRIISN